MNIVKSQIEVLAPTNMYSIIPTQKKKKNGQMDKVYYYYGNLIFFSLTNLWTAAATKSTGISTFHLLR